MNRLFQSSIFMVAIFMLTALFTPLHVASAQDAGVQGVTKRWSNIYRNPDATSGVVGAIPPNTSVKIVDASVSNWVKIDSEAGNGWIPITALSDTPVNNDDGGSQVDGSQSEAIRWTNVYTEPDAESTVVGTLAPGDKLTIKRRQAFWILIENNQVNGWVPINALAILPEFDGEIQRTGLTGRWTNLYNAPNTSAGVVGVLPPNTEVRIVDRLAPNWIRVESEHGKGWIPLSALSSQQVPGPDGEDQLAGTKVVVNRWTNIFTEASNDSTVVGAIPPRGEATVVQRQGFWLQVSSEFGDGWIPINAID